MLDPSAPCPTHRARRFDGGLRPAARPAAWEPIVGPEGSASGLPPGRGRAAATPAAPGPVVPAAVTAPAVKPAKPVMPKVPFVKIDLHSDSDEFEEVSASDYSSDSD